VTGVSAAPSHRPLRIGR